MLATIIFISIILSLVYLLLESAILPNERLKLRYDLFQLRDELRWKSINEPNSITDEEYKILSSTINGTISNMGHIVPSTLYKAHMTYSSNEEFRKSVDKKKAVIQNSQNEFVKTIDDRARGLTFMALGINSGGWMVLIVPIYMLYKLFLSLTNYALKIKEKIYQLIKIDELAFAPRYMVKSIIPDYEISQLDY